MQITVCLFALVFSDGGGRPDLSKDAAVAVAPDPEAVVAQCQKMTSQEFADFVELLGKKKDFASLAAIYQAGLLHSSRAAAAACRNMPPDKAGEFCSRFEVGSPNWKAAFRCLFDHPKKDVIGYVKRHMATSTGRIRAECYQLCALADWDDFLEEAKRDLNDDTDAVVWGVHFENYRETLGVHAKFYINTIADTRKRAVVDWLKKHLWPFDFPAASTKTESHTRRWSAKEDAEWQAWFNSDEEGKSLHELMGKPDWPLDKEDK
jgi:hypothetical protein